MRIHFPSLSVTPDAHTPNPRDHALAALNECKKAGTIARHVTFKTLETKGRRGPGSALEIQLEAATRDRGRRSGNSGAYGAMNDGTYAATYDEWGFFLAALYRRAGRDLIVGSPTYPNYYDEGDFHEKTGGTYSPKLADFIENHGDPYPYIDGRTSMLGRRGAGRLSEDAPSATIRYAVKRPRTAAWVRDFQRGQVH